jgi:DNA-binding MarR family transcriptional regulator
MKCLCATMRRSSRLLTRYYEKELRESGLTPAQFEIMAVLSGRRKVSQSELAEVLVVDQTTLSRNMGVLITRGWIIGTGSSGDKRRVVYSLSGPGGKIFRAAVPRWERAQKNMQRILGGEWETTWSSIELIGEGVLREPDLAD